MGEYEFILEDGEVKMVFDGVSHRISSAFVKGQNLIYVHPTINERVRGIDVISKELTQDDIQNINQLLED